jgi:hypothetical protein
MGSMFSNLSGIVMLAALLGMVLPATATAHYHWSLDIIACAGSLMLYWSQLLKPRRATAHCESVERAPSAERRGQRWALTVQGLL